MMCSVMSRRLCQRSIHAAVMIMHFNSEETLLAVNVGLKTIAGGQKGTLRTQTAPVLGRVCECFECNKMALREEPRPNALCAEVQDCRPAQ